MSRIPSFPLSFFISSIMTSTDYGAQAVHLIYGQVVDEKGDYVNGADVLIESSMDRRHTVSSGDGNFFSDIYIGGAFDEIYIKALYGMKSGAEKICAHGGHISIDISIRDTMI